MGKRAATIPVEKIERSVFDLTHQERESDFTGTPYGLMVMMDRKREVAFVDRLPEDTDILIEWPVSDQCAKKSGYSRFLQLRGGQYVAVKAPALRETASVQ